MLSFCDVLPRLAICQSSGGRFRWCWVACVVGIGHPKVTGSCPGVGWFRSGCWYLGFGLGLLCCWFGVMWGGCFVHVDLVAGVGFGICRVFVLDLGSRYPHLLVGFGCRLFGCGCGLVGLPWVLGWSMVGGVLGLLFLVVNPHCLQQLAAPLMMLIMSCQCPPPWSHRQLCGCANCLHCMPVVCPNSSSGVVIFDYSGSAPLVGS